MSEHRRRAPTGMVLAAALIVIALPRAGGAQLQAPRGSGSSAAAEAHPRNTVAADPTPRPGSAVSSLPPVVTSNTHEQRLRVMQAAERLRQIDAEIARAIRADTVGIGVDTVRSGEVVVIVDSRDAELARGAARRASVTLEATYGSAARRIAAEPAVIRRASRPVRERDLGRGDEDRDTTVLAGISRIGTTHPLPQSDETGLAQHLLRHGLDVMRRGMDVELRNWTGSYTSSAQEHERFASVFEELATSQSHVARDCLVGDLAQCRESLVLQPTEAPLWRWYGAEYRRELVRVRRSAMRPADPARYDLCVEGSQVDCDMLLRAHPPNNVAPPISARSRETLVALAVEIGGSDAFERLMAGVDRPLEERLAHAAGIPFDSLLGRWQARVATSRPHRGSVPFGRAAMSLAWIAFFGFLSTRSSRWR